MPQKPANIDFRNNWFRAIAFVVGFCVMTVELISGRLIAPYLGNSLYTWTAVLTAVLTAIALGSYVGGKLSAGKNIWSNVWTWLVISGGLSLLTMFPTIAMLGPILQMSDLPISLLTLLFSFFIFFPQAFTLAIITPLLVNADVSRVEESGSRFGSLAAWNAGGSILGTYATGFIFISFLNTTHIVLTIVAVLFIVASIDYLYEPKTSIV